MQEQTSLATLDHTQTVAVVDFKDAPENTSSRFLADLPDCVVSGNPFHTNKGFYTNPDSGLTVGCWTSTPGKWHAFPDKDEFCTIIEGHCALIDAAGNRREFFAGDSFVIPNGFRGYWEVIKTTIKHYVILPYPAKGEK